MSIRRGCVALALACLTIGVGTASAQAQRCLETETLQQCRERFISAPLENERRDLQQEATGPGLTPLARSAIRDFLPRFAGELLTADPTEEIPALALRFNTPIGTNVDRRLALQGGATFHEASPFEALSDSVPAELRAAFGERLADELERGDDVSLTAAINLESAFLGRTLAPFQNLIDSLTRQLVTRAASETGNEAALDDALREFNHKLMDGTATLPGPGCAPEDTQTYPVACLTEAARIQYETLLAQYAAHARSRMRRIASSIEANGFDRISDLVNNQPQLNFTVEYRSRVAVVGPNEWTGRARWEFLGANMNGLRRHCGTLSRVRLACYQDYVRLPSVRRSLERGERAWIEGIARYRPRYRVELADDSVRFATGAATGFGVSGGYGFYLGSIAAGEERDRLDAQVSYDFAQGDALRQSRFLIGATYTLRINGNASGVVGVAWANRPEFVAGADRNLHANIGLSYKINRGTDDDEQ